MNNIAMNNIAMKIGHYSPGIWAKGGVASYIRRVGQGQQNFGHEVSYIALTSEKEACAGATEPTAFVEDEAAVFRLAAERKLDILHVHLALSGRAKPTVPLIRTVHGHQAYCPSGGRFLARQNKPCDRPYSALGCTWNHIVNHCGSVRPVKMLSEFQTTWDEMRTLRGIPCVTVSHFIKRQMVESGYREEQIHVLHLPAPDVKAYAPPPQEEVPRFLFLGRITPQKGVAWLLRAVQQVCVPVHLDIAGEGHQEAEMQQLAKELGIADRVTFHGWVSGDEVNRLLARSRALVFPSLWHEPGGTVAFEAMVNGRAVIMSRVGGMPEVITEGVNGLLVEPSDVAGLAQAMTRLAEDQSLAVRLGEAGRRAAENFTLASHVKSLMDIYARYAAVPIPGQTAARPAAAAASLRSFQ